MSSASAEDRDAGGVEIVSKAAAAIFVLERHGELTAPALAELVDEPVSSTYRLLAQLHTLGWVDRGSRRGLFRLGLMFLRIGGLVEDRIDLRRAAWPALQFLFQRTGTTSFLCVRRGDRAVCIERLDGGDVRSLAMRLGDSLPLHSGGASMAILSFLPSGERNAYLEHLRSTYGQQVARNTAVEIERVRDRGYSISDGDVTPGIAAIGAPVHNHRGELEAAVSISALRHRILTDPDESGRLIRSAAAQVSSRLGAPGAP